MTDDLVIWDTDWACQGCGFETDILTADFFCASCIRALGWQVDIGLEQLADLLLKHARFEQYLLSRVPV